MKAFLLPLLAMAALPAGAQLTRSGSAVPPAEARAALDFHNKVRAEVGTPPLVWSETLAAYAQAWADEQAKRGCRMQHRPQSGAWAQQYGENIFWGNGRYFDAAEAARSWYSEKKDFSYGPVTATNFTRIGHYSQMVWSSSTEVGMGAARCANGSWIIVANYSPRGNYLNVKPY